MDEWLEREPFASTQIKYFPVDIDDVGGCDEIADRACQKIWDFLVTEANPGRIEIVFVLRGNEAEEVYDIKRRIYWNLFNQYQGGNYHLLYRVYFTFCTLPPSFEEMLTGLDIIGSPELSYLWRK